MAKRKTQFYNLEWSRLLPDEYKNASDMDRVRGWNMIKGMNATEVARKLETTIIPKMLRFELQIWDSYGEGHTIMEGDDQTIRINRNYSISPTILRALN
jgi:hypothetical protein